MHCLLCHEKISRIRHWRTKSEFCCDEHAATHRQQTLDRLFDPQEGDSEGADVRDLDSLGSSPAAREKSGFEPTITTPAIPKWINVDTEAGEEAAASTREGGEAASAERDETIERRRGRRQFSLAGVQHDEPFPIEVQPAHAMPARGEDDDPYSALPASEQEAVSKQEAARNQAEEEWETRTAAREYPASEGVSDADVQAEQIDEQESVDAVAETQGQTFEPDAVPDAEQALAGDSEEETFKAEVETELQISLAGEQAEAAAPQREEVASKAEEEIPVEPAATTKDHEAVKGLTELANGVQALTPRATDTNWSARAPKGKRAVMICFLPVQGGNGASTVSLHVAEAISRNLNDRVLLADFDFHSGTLAFRLGLKPSQTLADVFASEKDPENLWKDATCSWKGLDVLVAPPSNKSLPATSLERLPEVFASAARRYPYVIVDHPDAIYSSSRHILTLSDLVYLVCTPEITSLHLARRKVQQILAMGVPSDQLRLIVNRAGSWGSLGIEDVGRIVGVPVSWALDNDYAALRDATWNGGLVKEGSALARQLLELGSSVMRSDSLTDAKSETWEEVGAPTA